MKLEGLLPRAQVPMTDTNPGHNLPFYFGKTHFNTKCPSICRSAEWSLHFRLSEWTETKMKRENDDCSGRRVEKQRTCSPLTYKD